MSENEELLTEFVNKNVNRLWLLFRDKWQETPKPLQDFFENIPVLFANIELDNDLRNKKEVYLDIAKFIQKKFNQPLPICLGATHFLCREPEKLILKDGVSGKESLALAKEAKSFLLTIKVSYNPTDSQAYKRLIEIYYMSNNQPTLFKLEELLEWDYLPSDVREKRIRQGNTQSQVFKLYPPKEV